MFTEHCDYLEKKTPNFIITIYAHEILYSVRIRWDTLYLYRTRLNVLKRDGRKNEKQKPPVRV